MIRLSYGMEKFGSRIQDVNRNVFAAAVIEIVRMATKRRLFPHFRI